MSRCTLRYLFTVVMYAGIVISLIPYISGKISTGMVFLIAGGGIAILSGFGGIHALRLGGERGLRVLLDDV